MSTESQLRDRMTAHVQDVTPGGPDFAGASATARRQRRTRTGAVAGVTVAVVALAAVGVAAAASHRTDRVQPASPKVTPTSGLPGLVAAGSVRVPAGLSVEDAQRAGDQVWATATSGSTSADVVVLHGRIGGALSVVNLGALDEHSTAITLAVAGNRAYVATAPIPGSTHQPTYVDERDATTGTDEGRYDLRSALDPAGHAYHATYAALVDDDDAAPILAVTSEVGGRYTLRTVVLDPASPAGARLSTEATPAQAVPTLTAAAPDAVDYVTTVAGVPTFAYLAAGQAGVPIVDLQTGRIGTYRTGENGHGFGLGTAAIGTVRGRVAFVTSGSGFAPDQGAAHLQLAAPGATSPAATGPAASNVIVVGGSAYDQEDVGVNGEDWQQLTPETLRPSGPVLMTFSPNRTTGGHFEFVVTVAGRTVDGGTVHFFTTP